MSTSNGRNTYGIDGKVVIEPKVITSKLGNKGVMLRLLNDDGRKVQFWSIYVWNGTSKREQINFAWAAKTRKGDMLSIDGHLRQDKFERAIIAVSDNDSFVNITQVHDAAEAKANG